MTRTASRVLGQRLAERHGGRIASWSAVVDAYTTERPDASEANVEAELDRWWRADQEEAEGSPLHESGLGSYSGGRVRQSLLELALDHGLARLLAAALCAEVGS